MNPRLAAIVSAALLHAGCAAPPSLTGCTCDAECGEGNACFAGACVVNAPPSVEFEPPTDASTHRLLPFVASTSDPEGGPVSIRWTFLPVADGCDPEPEPAEGDRIEVVFWCPGRYEATAVPVDPGGLEGTPVVHAFDVAASVGAPSVTPGPAIQALHRCDLGVPRCVVLGPDEAEALKLTALAMDPDGETLRFEWRAIPPPAVAADPTLRVTFLPDPMAPEPLASAENGGGAIAGTWRFRVRAFDSAGLLGQAEVTVEVANAPPVVAPSVTVLPHRFAGGAYVAEGEAAVGVVDPDGDAVSVVATLADPPPESCAESLAPSGDAWWIAISCTDPADLIGPEGRALRVQATDVHGAELHFDLPVAIENRPPVLHLPAAEDPAVLELDHATGACTLAKGDACFVVEGADPFLIVDPDGDPLGGYAFAVAVAGDRPAARGAAWLDGGTWRFRFEAPVALPLQFRSADGASSFGLTAVAHDPWEASAPAVVPLRIRNRAPVVVEAGPTVAVNHAYEPALLRYTATAPGPRFADPDGDPLSTVLTTSAPCQAATLDADGWTTVHCARTWDWRSTSRPPLAEFAVATEPGVLASDGWEAAASPAPITILDRPPILSAADDQSLEGCACSLLSSCPGGLDPLVGFRVGVTYRDPDGDPALVTPDFGPSLVDQQPPVACLGWSCAPYLYVDASAFTSTLPLHVFGGVTADTGAAKASDPLLSALLSYDARTADACP